MASDDDEPVYCTRAITGSQYPTHQPIYICYTCQLFEPEKGRVADNEDDDGGGDGGDDGDDGGGGDVGDDSNSVINEPLPACICESCAFECHADHECYHVGVGLCTCDCPLLVCTNNNNNNNNNNSNNSESDDDDGDGDILPVRHECRLARHSANQVERIGFGDIRPLNYPIPLKLPSTIVTSEEVPKDDVNENKDEKKKDGNNATKEEKEHIDLSRLVPSNPCMECHSTMGGYNYASFTLPALVENGGKLCQNLIRQAEVLTDHSRDTFWIPEDAMNENNANHDGNEDDEWCDLEIFAKQIYQQHIQSYSLQQTPSNNEEQKYTKGDINNASKSSATAAAVASPSGGAEWWVQVKPAGQSRAPVDLHYDKDEVLAETFGLGSFPTLSTVTYLTGEEDNSPTVVFPHTYHDEEDHGIGSMLFSCARRAKHIVFDGRLLHGAPAHPSLRKRSNIINVQNNVESNNGGDAVAGESSLRVTFLVNIWKSGRPAGVHVLPRSIRSKIQSDATTETIPFQDGVSLEFEQRHTSKLSVNSSTKTFMDDDGSGKTTPSEEDRIVLPFVSAGATWIGGDETDIDAEASGGDESVRDEGDKEDGSTNAIDEGEDDEEEGDNNDSENGGDDDDEEGGDDSDDDEEEEEDSDLFLVVPPFATPEYLDDKADTFVLLFEDDNEVRLVRGVALDKMTQPNCRWRNLVAKNKSENSQTAATEFLLHLHEHVPPFISSIVAELKNQCNIDVSKLQADHVCYRTDSLEQYTSLVEALQCPDVDDFTLLVESEIGGRPIATFKLAEPIEIQSVDSSYHHSINVVEIPSPKEGSPYEAGLEHVEFVIGGSTNCKSPINDDTHHEVLTSWMERYPEVSWNTKALRKQCNPDISTKLQIRDYGKVSIKFHLMPLEKVIEFEVGGS